MTAFFDGKRVLLTGNTGFKGSWLTLWLLELGAKVHGLALMPEDEPSMFSQLDLISSVDCHICDVRDSQRVLKKVHAIQPDIVFHLAAQPLVRKSYTQPRQTWDVNLMGTLNLLEALKTSRKQCAIVVVTTDKVYENNGSSVPFCETDPLGGHDPYSASKAATELMVASWRRSFVPTQPNLKIATARAGNVIGGGDWAEDRLIPDVMRALLHGEEFVLRNPVSTRPWQHVLEPLSGYLRLAEMLYADRNESHSYNFGPDLTGVVSTQTIVETIYQHWPGSLRVSGETGALHEASSLSLDTSKADHEIGYSPRWDLARAIKETVSWYRAVAEENLSAQETTLKQIKIFGQP